MVFKRFNSEQYTDFLARFLPNGQLFTAKFIEETVLRQWLQGLAPEVKRAGDSFVTHLEQLDPNTTDNYLNEWESALQIPDDCIPTGSTSQERRDNILLKLASLSVQTDQDFIDLAAEFGFTVTIEYLDSIFPPYDVPFLPATEPENRFVWIVNGNFSIDPAKAIIIQCLFEKLTAANTKVIFVAT